MTEQEAREEVEKILDLASSRVILFTGSDMNLKKCVLTARHNMQSFNMFIKKEQYI